MWPFKKKQLLGITQEIIFETVICIPGEWDSREDFILAIVESSNGEYIAAGNILMNARKQNHYTLEFCGPDERMSKSFRYAGIATGVTEDFLSNLENHKHVIYISGPTGNLKDAENIAFAAEAILKSGGIGIKIETSGKAFENKKWHELLEVFEESNLYEMFVVDSIADEDMSIHSCGMQNLGLKDTIVSNLEFQDAIELISIFSYYQIIDKPTITNLQTFQKNAGSSIFRIIEEHNQPYEGGPFENPFGMWRLSKL